LSRAFLELPARFDDGIRLETDGYALHIAPLARRSAIRISVNAADAEFARSLALSARDLARALEDAPEEN
ncbi:MAG: hypothetical protein J5967_08035, partial [Oscillospiraceae bacterium]|nr:hypothetical protein [Oscillospiraceae bacterium]